MNIAEIKAGRIDAIDRIFHNVTTKDTFTIQYGEFCVKTLFFYNDEIICHATYNSLFVTNKLILLWIINDCVGAFPDIVRERVNYHFNLNTITCHCCEYRPNFVERIFNFFIL